MEDTRKEVERYLRDWATFMNSNAMKSPYPKHLENQDSEGTPLAVGAAEAVVVNRVLARLGTGPGTGPTILVGLLMHLYWDGGKFRDYCPLLPDQRALFRMMGFSAHDALEASLFRFKGELTKEIKGIPRLELENTA